VGRYGAAAKFDPLAEKTGEFETRGVVVFSPSMIDGLDYFVFTLRSKFDFFIYPGMDYLAAWIQKRRDSLIVKTTAHKGTL
jgi:hypothetical protein